MAIYFYRGTIEREAQGRSFLYFRPKGGGPPPPAPTTFGQLWVTFELKITVYITPKINGKHTQKNLDSGEGTPPPIWTMSVILTKI